MESTNIHTHTRGVERREETHNKKRDSHKFFVFDGRPLLAAARDLSGTNKIITKKNKRGNILKAQSIESGVEFMRRVCRTATETTQCETPASAREQIPLSNHSINMLSNSNPSSRSELAEWLVSWNIQSLSLFISISFCSSSNFKCTLPTLLLLVLFTVDNKQYYKIYVT
jgi:hypothetical protein